MSNEDPTPDEFDAALGEITVELPAELNIRAETAVLDSMILQPEVASALAAGIPIKAIAAQMGVSEQNIRRRLKTAPMEKLLEIESRRLIRHMMGRKLSNEKYLGLMTALSYAIDKTRLLRNEPTEIMGNISTKTIERIQIGIFGQVGRIEGPSNPLLRAGTTIVDAKTVSQEPDTGRPEAVELHNLGDSKD